MFKGALASRADDSTFLGYADPNFANTLLLPNRDLDFGYAKLDLGMTYQLKGRVALVCDGGQPAEPAAYRAIGYPGLPLTVRVGLKIRMFGDSF